MDEMTAVLRGGPLDGERREITGYVERLRFPMPDIRPETALRMGDRYREGPKLLRVHHVYRMVGRSQNGLVYYEYEGVRTD